MTAMKRRLRLPVLLLCVTIAGCETYIAEDRYPTLADAKADHLFERGWLPDLLPPSSVDIHTVNNLDASTSTGSFRFMPSEGSLLFGKLVAGAPADAPISDWPEMLADYRQRGFTAWSHREGDGHWVFFCLASAGKCEYTMWSTRWQRSAPGR